jgi:Uri superfamily endonuclease
MELMGKGTYLLILRLGTHQHRLQVGRLGRFDFAPGYYLYVGSAFGAGGLQARLNHHWRQVKTRPHWHIDYLRAHADLVEIWSACCPVPLEQVWGELLRQRDDLAMPIPGFGASDTPLSAHLFYRPVPPSISLLSDLVLGSPPLTDLRAPGMRIEVHTGVNGAAGWA